MNKNINSEDSSKSKWPDSVLLYQGIKDAVPFEVHRDEFFLPVEDPLK